MPIKVYIWLPHGENLGHSSLELSDGTYISWWPTKKEFKNKSSIVTRVGSILRSPAALSENLDEDNGLEGNPPNIIYTLPDGRIDEDAIREWWVPFSMNQEYRVFDQNCCHVVFKALEAGRAWMFITDEDVIRRGSTLLKPVEIDRLVNKLLMILQN
ncbi:hypothetical protein ACJMK2_014896 [Sinanodonta woodiana]|uniref:Uncharacterized protein n=1 Tax=Sinanodonta woodiana TaxID=1069815 RepID=A0ABD3V2P8_SINWO